MSLEKCTTEVHFGKVVVSYVASGLSPEGWRWLPSVSVRPTTIRLRLPLQPRQFLQVLPDACQKCPSTPSSPDPFHRHSSLFFHFMASYSSLAFWCPDKGRSGNTNSQSRFGASRIGSSGGQEEGSFCCALCHYWGSLHRHLEAVACTVWAPNESQLVSIWVPAWLQDHTARGRVRRVCWGSLERHQEAFLDLLGLHFGALEGLFGLHLGAQKGSPQASQWRLKSEPE